MKPALALALFFAACGKPPQTTLPIGMDEGVVASTGPTGPSFALEARFSGGFRPVESTYSQVVPAHIFNDGRYIWCSNSFAQDRQVLTVQLSSEQRTEISEAFASAGFWQWRNDYTDPSLADGIEETIALSVASESKTVSVYGSTGPTAFSALLSKVASGWGYTGQPYQPSTATIDAHTAPSGATGIAWPSGDAGFELSASTENKPLPNPALQSVFTQLNHSTSTVYASAGANYYIDLHVPELEPNR